MKRFTFFLTIAVVIGTATGLYGQLTVNIAGSSTGGSVATTVVTPPSNQTALLGGSFTLTVAATGANLTYQWRKGGVDILNATSATYTKASARADDAGAYTVVVHGDCGADVTPTAATVVVKGVYLSAKIFLEGAYDAGTGLMRDYLRTQSTFPKTEPYAGLGYTHVGGGGETTTNGVLATTGNDAIVDWVMVELRGKTAPATVLATASGLLQRDGDIVAGDGTSPLSFGLASDDYYILIRHRNHVRFRSNATLTFSGSTPTVANFTDGSTAPFGTGALKTISSIKTMYSGDPSGNGFVSSSDYNSYWLPNSGQMLPYDLSDFNMDGFTSATDINLFWAPNAGIFIPIY